MKELPVRKKIRLEDYDYSSNGAYFITICVKYGHELLGKVVGAAICRPSKVVGAATCRPSVELSEIGEIAEKSMKSISEIYPHILVDNHVIMPNHIHMILRVVGVEDGRQIC